MTPKYPLDDEKESPGSVIATVLIVLVLAIVIMAVKP